MHAERSTGDRVRQAVVGVLATFAYASQLLPSAEPANVVPDNSSLFSNTRSISPATLDDDLAMIVNGKVVQIHFEPVSVTSARGEFARALKDEDFQTTQDAVRQILNNLK